MPKKYLMGNVCVKTGGHTQWRGERDYGACGGHFGADIYLVPHKDQHRDIDWEAVALSQGDRENDFEDTSWKLHGLEEEVKKALAAMGTAEYHEAKPHKSADALAEAREILVQALANARSEED